VSGLIDTTEMYLRTIYELLEEGVAPLRARIAERLQQSGPTVSQTVSRMERDGLLRVHEDRRILLSDEGERLAMRVMRRHRLAERHLVDVIGLEWPLVHDEACKWEHVIGSTVEVKLVTLLAEPDESPYGTPIPRLDDTVPAALARFRAGAGPLSERLREDGTAGPVRLVRIGEYLQREADALSALCAVGIRPGVDITARCDRTKLTLVHQTAECHLDVDWADQLFVAESV
jgi:DtxR family Mn-dependent transcriptional regulator